MSGQEAGKFNTRVFKAVAIPAHDSFGRDGRWSGVRVDAADEEEDEEEECRDEDVEGLPVLTNGSCNRQHGPRKKGQWGMTG